MPEASDSSEAGLAIDVAALRRKGIDRQAVAVDLSTDWLAQTLSDTDAMTEEAGRIEVELLLPTEGAVVAHGSLTVRFDVPCGRCLQPAHVDGSTMVHATFVHARALPQSGPTGEEEGEEGIGLTDEDLDTWLYDGVTVDLAKMVSEHVKLAYPMRALCPLGEACRGLCSNCGTDLNVKPPVGGHCAACGAEVAAVAGEPQGQGDKEGPLAEALRKLLD